MYDRPLFVSYGMGVDSTAVLVGFQSRGIIPDAITFADVGDEKVETREYFPIISEWLAKHGFPPISVVRYVPKRFKYAPGYKSLGENCLCNATLPSLAFGMKACSLKWKVAPQERFDAEHPLAKTAWAMGRKVTRAIGYDASPADSRRATYAGAKGENPKYNFVYPLRDWGWTRQQCIAEIEAAGLPAPPKSACVFCPATKPDELRTFRPEYLRKIVLMEARAHDGLQGNWDQAKIDELNAERRQRWRETGGPEPKEVKVGEGTQGLWRSATKTRSGRMTDFIEAEGLLLKEEIDRLKELVDAVPFSTQREFEDEYQTSSWGGLCSACEVEPGGFVADGS
jgi:hypothetical protein